MAHEAYEEILTIPVGAVELTGDLTLPDDPRGLVVFAHGSGSSRNSARNQYVARTMVEHGLGTLLFDLLTTEEAREDAVDRHLRFDIPMLAERLDEVTEWLGGYRRISHLRVGYFGSSTGAAAALIAASERPDDIQAVVSRGGRPDLAGDALERVRAPTLLIVGGADWTVLEINKEALQRIPGEHNLEVIPGATHLFEEPGALEDAAEIAAEWFVRHLGAAPEQHRPPVEGA